MAADIPMADLAKRWGVTANTVSRRLTYLKIKPKRQGNYRYITVEQLNRADALDQHVCKNKVMYTFVEPAIIEDEKEERYGKIYFIGSRSSGPIKIGFSGQSDLKSRLSQLQTSSPEHLEILGSFSGYLKNERKVHDFLALHRLRGEWFERDAALAVCNYFKTEKKNNKFAGELSDVAWSLDGVKDDEYDDDSYEEPLAVAVGRALLLDYWERLWKSYPDEPLPFRAWLLTQAERDHATAELANDCKHDPRFPAVASLPEYLQHVSGSWEVTRTVIDAWVECHAAVFSLAH
jgi:hypothetical protein